jgi:hypothetical protein
MWTAAVSLAPRARHKKTSEASHPQPHSHRKRNKTAHIPHGRSPAAPPAAVPVADAGKSQRRKERRARSHHPAPDPPMSPSTLLVRPPAPASPCLQPRRYAPASAAAAPATLRASPAASSVAQFSRFLSPSLSLSLGVWFFLD